MTGPVGARINRPIALVTDDFRLYHRLAPFFEDHGLPLVGVAPGEPVPASARVILGGPADDRRSVGLREAPEATLLAVLQALDMRPAARDGYDEVVFGLDPGRTIGLAVVAAGQPLLVGEERGPKVAVERLRMWRSGLWAKAWRVRIGDGSPGVGQGIAQEVRRVMPDAVVEFVAERATTPYSAATKSRHTDAAIRIAARSGLGHPTSQDL